MDDINNPGQPPARTAEQIAAAEAKAAELRKLSEADAEKLGESKPLGDIADMLDQIAKDCFPADDDGKVHFARSIMEGSAWAIRRYLAEFETVVFDPVLVTPRATPLTPDEVDALSFAARTAQDAAASLYGLFATEEGTPVNDWLGLRQGELEAALEGLVRFIVEYRADNPETVWLQAVSEGLAIREAPSFRDLPFARRQAYATFTRVAAATHAAIAQVQAATAAELEAQRAAAAIAPLKREDSILEEGGSLGELIPGAEEFLERQRGAFNGADPARFDHDGDGKPGGSKPKAAAIDDNPAGSGAPLSIGEKPATTTRPNQGGRPRKGGKR